MVKPLLLKQADAKRLLEAVPIIYQLFFLASRWNCEGEQPEIGSFLPGERLFCTGFIISLDEQFATSFPCGRAVYYLPFVYLFDTSFRH